MLLSSMAESMYWCGRYLERAEAVSRVLRAYEGLALDLPGERALDLRPLLRLIGEQPQARAGATRRQLFAELISDGNNCSTVLGALHSARENLREARGVAPEELWLIVNQLHGRVSGLHGETEAVLLSVLEEVCAAGARFDGEAASSMARDGGYAFLTMGRQLERGDMLLRSLDTLLPVLQPDGWERVFDDVRFSGLLQALGVQAAYRRRFHHGAEPTHLLELLLVRRDCPRSLACCMLSIEEQLVSLPRTSRIRSALAVAQRDGVTLRRSRNGHFQPDLTTALDSLSALHDAIQHTYFPTPEAPRAEPAAARQHAHVPTDPFEYLGREHVHVDAALRVLDELTLKAVNREAVDRAELNTIVTFLTDFGTLKHHEKEESILTPQLVAHGFDWYEGPLAMMRRDHRQEHYFVRTLTQLATQTHDWTTAEYRKFADVARELCHFLRAHMDHERRDLFEQAARTLPRQVQQNLLDAFREFDRQLPVESSKQRDAFEQLLARYGVTTASAAE